ESIPVFVKGGSVIPMLPAFENTASYPKDQLILHYYAAEGSATRELYEDDGINPKALAAKQHELIKLYGMKKENNASIMLSSTGLYAGKPLQRNVEVFVHGLSNVSEVQLNKQTWKQWKLLENGTLQLSPFTWKGNAITITFQ
ncbi:MAG TPA: DUF5110 domain-containing protein, partial [Chitinophagaceae bacterium]|nr:DUF5110 domain-containing protein [Chitinophagaceae bacterium]